MNFLAGRRHLLTSPNNFTGKYKDVHSRRVFPSPCPSPSPIASTCADRDAMIMPCCVRKTTVISQEVPNNAKRSVSSLACQPLPSCCNYCTILCNYRTILCNYCTILCNYCTILCMGLCNNSNGKGQGLVYRCSVGMCS